MQRLKAKLSNRPGFTLVLSVLLIMVFIGAAAFAVDASHAQVWRADTHAAADAAALAGIQKYAETDSTAAALTEAQAFAAKYKADTATLTVLAADFALGKWDSTTALTCSPLPGCAFTSGGTPINAAEATVRYSGTYMFGPVLGIGSHSSVGTSVAVGVASKTISASSCVAPVVMPYSDMLSQIGLGQGISDTLTAADIDSLVKANSGKAVTFDIPNGTKVSGIQSQEFYQINVPPKETASGTHQNDGPPSSSDFKNGFTCTGGSYTIGVGDWVEPINGQKANQAKQGMQNINSGTFPVTFEVALAGVFGNSPDGFCQGCFQIKYLGSFTATSVGGKSVTGYFNTLSPPSGGVVASGSGSGPLEMIQKTRLVY